MIRRIAKKTRVTEPFLPSLDGDARRACTEAGRWSGQPVRHNVGGTANIGRSGSLTRIGTSAAARDDASAFCRCERKPESLSETGLRFALRAAAIT